MIKLKHPTIAGIVIEVQGHEKQGWLNQGWVEVNPEINRIARHKLEENTHD